LQITDFIPKFAAKRELMNTFHLPGNGIRDKGHVTERARNQDFKWISFEPLLNATEAAEMIGVHPVTLLRWARENRLPCRRVGRKVSFRATELNAWDESQPSFKLETPFMPPNQKEKAHET